MAPPSLLERPEVVDALLDAVEHGVPIATAAAAAEVSPSTIYEWLQVADSHTWRNGTPVTDAQLGRILRFSERFRGAQARWEQRLVRQLGEDADSVNEKTGQRDWRAKAWLLNNHPATRATYRQQREMTVTQQGTVSHEHQLVSGMSEPELLAAAGSDWELLATPPSLPAPAERSTRTDSDESAQEGGRVGSGSDAVGGNPPRLGYAHHTCTGGHGWGPKMSDARRA